MIKQTIFSVSTDETRQSMNGELLQLRGGTLELASTDGFRVSVRTADIFGAQLDEADVISMDFVLKAIIPSKALNEISHILPNSGSVNIYLTDKHVLFEPEGCIVVSRLIDGQFLNYENIFLQECTTIVDVDRSRFADCIERASLLSRDARKSAVKISVKVDKIEVSSFTDLGAVYDEVDAEVDGLPLEIAFSPKFLLDALKAIEEEKITLQFTTPLSPCIIKSEENKEFKYLVVPLRIRQ